MIGPSYDAFDGGLSENIPPQSGLNLYLLTKNCGHEITRVYASDAASRNAEDSNRDGDGGDFFVLNALFSGFYNAEPSGEERYDGTGGAGGGTESMAISWGDAATMLTRCIQVPSERLTSRCQVLFGHTNHHMNGKYDNTLTRSLLGWQPGDSLSGYWSRIAADYSLQSSFLAK